MKQMAALITTIACLLAPKPALAEMTIRITNGEWAPYLSEHAYEYGLASHIVSEAFRLEGIKVKWGFFPWIRAYALARPNMAKTGMPLQSGGPPKKPNSVSGFPIR